jgi:hypothetical protein
MEGKLEKTLRKKFDKFEYFYIATGLGKIYWAS